MKALTTLFAGALLLTLTGCFKDQPKTQTFKAAGSWLVESVVIQNIDSLGNVANEQTITDAGILMLAHDDDFMFQDAYSYQLDATKLAPSSIYNQFNAGNTWGLGGTAQTFNVGHMDPGTGYVSRIASYTVLKLKHKEMELQYVHTTNNVLDYVEVWKLKKGTH